jgi:hypothetical protein
MNGVSQRLTMPQRVREDLVGIQDDSHQLINLPFRTRADHINIALGQVENERVNGRPSHCGHA